MIPVALAAGLRAAGLVWKPAPGDRFAVPDRDLDDEVFVLSNMVVEIHQLPEGRMIGFNGTTEWALDDLDQEEAVWLPCEDQLRELLGGTFRRLERVAEGFQVVTSTGGAETVFTGGTAEEAYGYALLRLIEAATT